MTEPSNTSETDHLQAALDATCAALLALQKASGELDGVGDGSTRPQQAEREAIEYVRLAIRELRRLIGEQTGSPLALGFVRGMDVEAAELSGDNQPNSRRIA
jgi:hypothetical protein